MKIKTSIHILFQLATRIKWVSETSVISKINENPLKQIKYNDGFFKIPYPDSVAAICQDEIIIISCSFLDEYEKNFTPISFPNHSEKIIEFKRLVSPAYKRIKKWKDLKKLRNQIIAHNHRINGQSIFEIENKITYNVPATNEEFTLLADLVYMIAENIQFLFQNEIEQIDFNVTLRDKMEYQSEKSDTYKEYKEIEEKIKNCL